MHDQNVVHMDGHKKIWFYSEDFKCKGVKMVPSETFEAILGTSGNFAVA